MIHARRNPADKDLAWKLGAMAGKSASKKSLKPRKRAKVSPESGASGGSEPHFILRVRPIPKPLHGVNLRTHLGDHRWRKLRHSLLDDWTRQCETCRKVVENSSKLSAHEEWEFDTESQPPTATVANIRFVCWHCHACEHFPHTLLLVRSGALSEQAVEDTIEHFCRVNKATKQQFAKHLQAAVKEWARLSEFNFRVDFGKFASA